MNARTLASVFVRALLTGLTPSPGGKPAELWPGLPVTWPGDAPLRRAARVGHARAGAAGLVLAVLGAGLPSLALLALLALLLPELVRRPLAASALAGLCAALPGVLAGLALAALRRLPGRLVCAGVAVCCGGLFVLGLKPFSMLLGGAVLGVLLLPEPEGRPAVPQGRGLGLKGPLALLGVFALAAAGLFAADAGLGRLFLASFKAEFWGLGGAGAWPLISGDFVRARHWVEPEPFRQLAGLALLVPGPAASLAAGAGMLARGWPGALAAGAGALLAPALTLLAVAPCWEAVGAAVWARKALTGVGAALCGLVAGLAVLTAQGPAWNAPALALAVAALGASLAGVGRAWIAAAAALAGAAFL